MGDFLGGVKARVLPALTVLACSQPIGLAAVAVAVAIHGKGPPGLAVLWACLAAVFGTSGLVAFYRGMAAGSISVVAPIAGTAAAIPVAWGLATGDNPSSVQELGFVLALGGIVATSWERRAESPRLAAGVGWAALTLVAFGGYYIPMHAASQEDFLWASLLFRATSTSLVWVAVLALRQRVSGIRPHVLALAAIGVLDTGGNVLFARGHGPARPPHAGRAGATSPGGGDRGHTRRRGDDLCRVAASQPPRAPRSDSIASGTSL